MHTKKHRRHRRQHKYNMRGCSQKRQRRAIELARARLMARAAAFAGGAAAAAPYAKMEPANNSLSLAYTGQPVKTINNPFLAYTGKGGACGACNTSVPADASNFLAYNGKGGAPANISNPEVFSQAPNKLAQNGGAAAGMVTANMLSDAEVFSQAPNLPTQMMGGAAAGMVTANMLSDAEVFSQAPNLPTQMMGGNKAAMDSGFPKPMAGANIQLSNSGSVFAGSAPVLVTGGAAPMQVPNNQATAGLQGHTYPEKPDFNIAKAYPVTNTSSTINWINGQTLKGGGCGCGAPILPTKGGTTSRPLNGHGARFGGGRRSRHIRRMHGGRNYGDLVPNGLLGQPWTGKISNWPGVDGTPMNRNHFPLNTYATDISRQTKDIGANFPFSGMPWSAKGGCGGTCAAKIGGRRKHRRSHKKRRGGALSNFLSQDFINLGREIGFNSNSAYNALVGQPAPQNPLPWKGQLVSNVSKM